MSIKFDSREFKQRLAKIPVAVRREVNKAIEKDAQEWVRMSTALAPKDPKDGIHLAPSIGHRQTETGGQEVFAGGEATTKSIAAWGGEELDYAKMQEFGREGQPPNPFFWPAYRSLKKKFTSRRKRALSKALKEI